MCENFESFRVILRISTFGFWIITKKASIKYHLGPITRSFEEYYVGKKKRHCKINTFHRSELKMYIDPRTEGIFGTITARTDKFRNVETPLLSFEKTVEID